MTHVLNPQSKSATISKDVHLGQVESQLKQWGAKIDALIARANEAGAEAKADYRKSIDDLAAKRQATQQKLDELRAAGNDKWETFKTDLDSARHELEVAFRKLTSN
jgi:hypothetical protein